MHMVPYKLTIIIIIIIIIIQLQNVCYLATSPLKEESLETEKVQYQLPDGQVIDVGSSKYRAPELLFRPDLVGEEYPGIHEVLTSAIQRSDIDLRKMLYSNVVLSGGSTMFKGWQTFFIVVLET